MTQNQTQNLRSKRERERVVPRVKGHRNRKLGKSLTSLRPPMMLEARISAKWSKVVPLLFDMRKLIPTTATAIQPFNIPTKRRNTEKLRDQNCQKGRKIWMWVLLKTWRDDHPISKRRSSPIFELEVGV